MMNYVWVAQVDQNECVAVCADRWLCTCSWSWNYAGDQYGRCEHSRRVRSLLLLIHNGIYHGNPVFLVATPGHMMQDRTPPRTRATVDQAAAIKQVIAALPEVTPITVYNAWLNVVLNLR